MKKGILAMSIMLLTMTLQSCPECFDYAGQRFRKTPFIKITDCNCPCANYPRSNHENGYRCIVCGHRMLPRNIDQKKETKKILQSLLVTQKK